MSALMNRIHIGFNTPENQILVDNSGRIPKRSLQITVGVLFGTAAITVILRTIRRIYLFRQFKLDDAFVVFGFLCLSATTGVFFHSLDIIMLQEALAMEPTVIVPITSISRLLNSMTFLDVFLCTIWTCTFAIKGSFLALFRKLIQGVSKNLDRYYWFVVVYTFVCWVFMVVEPFVLCPYFGTEGAKCYPEDNYPKTLGLTILISILDIASDILIASIPILLLRKSRMEIRQKLSLGLFLCLSLVMAIFALIRVAGIKRGAVIDNTWSLFWQYSEGCVACIMASITPFRTLFTGLGSQASRSKKKGPSTSLRQLFWKRRSNNSDDTEMSEKKMLPAPPGATMPTLRNFIRRNNRETGEDTVLVTSTFGVEETISDEPERDYQRYLRKAAGISHIQQAEPVENRKHSAGEMV